MGAVPEAKQVQGEIRDVAIADLQRHPQNYRTHPEAQLLRLDESLRRYGQRSAVVVQASTMRIIAHHAVVQSAERLGWDTVRCDVWTCDDTEAAAYLVDDNSLQRFAEDDEAALAGLLVTLQEADAAPVSFDKAELDALLEQSMTPGPFPYNPNLSPELQVKEYSDEDVQKEGDKLDHKFEGQKEKVPVMCPYCGKEFQIDK